MKKLFALMLGLLLTACAAPAVVEVDPNLDLATLPDTIDVHTAAALQDRNDVLLIDVRENWEYEEGHIPNITHIPIGEVSARIAEIPTDVTVILTCRSGARSGQVYEFLTSQGFANVHNMDGGIVAWGNAGYAISQ